MRLSWFVYRGAGKVTFDPPQIEVWEDYRDGANSPWAAGLATPPIPPGGKWEIQARFSAPGHLRAAMPGHDGGLLTTEDVTFIVE